MSAKWKGIRTLLVASLAFVLIVTSLNRLANSLLASVVASGLRARVAVELTSAMLAEAALLLLVRAYLQRQGLTLRALGLRRNAPAAGWLSATALAALFIGFNLALPLRGNPGLTELSLFRIYNAVLAGVTAGFAEETLFRGFLMEELRRSGFSTAAQLILSSLCYGAAHAAWGLTSGMFTLEIVGTAVVGTTVFGICCAAVYLLSRRSLAPVIFSHGLMNLVIEPWLFMTAVAMTRH